MKIPRNFYDIGDGIYDPENRIVYDYKMQFLRNAGRYALCRFALRLN